MNTTAQTRTPRTNQPRTRDRGPAPRHEVRHLVLASTPASVQGTLALGFEPLLDPPDLCSSPGESSSDRIALPPEMRLRLEQWTRRHLQAVVEIAGGDRPASQLVRWCVPSVHHDLTRRALLATQSGGLSATAGRRAGAARVKVLSVRLQIVAQDAFEACAHVSHGDRDRALAVRYEHRRNRWMAVALEFA